MTPNTSRNVPKHSAINRAASEGVVAFEVVVPLAADAEVDGDFVVDAEADLEVDLEVAVAMGERLSGWAVERTLAE
jgi:hypothetical protein